MSKPLKPGYELSDAEKRDLIRLIQEGKPLPEQYRFVLFEDKREVELVWNGKTREVCTTVLPFQSLEQVDEPRREAPESPQLDLFDSRGRQLKGWTNKLIWGDDKLILSSLKSGALRRQIEDAGGLKLIYIDPPFDVGADFSMDIEIGGETFHKEPNLLEQIAYRDTWGRGADSFISMIYERLILMRDLLAEDGSVYVHMGPTINHFIREALDEVFGRENAQREIIWKRVSSRSHGNYYPATHDSILFYSKSSRLIWNQIYEPLDTEYVESKYRFADPDGRRYRKDNCLNQNPDRPNLTYEWNGHTRTWRWTKEKMQQLHDAGWLIYTKSGIPEYKRYLDQSEGVALQSVWTDINPVNSQAREDTDYPTQKPEALLERILKASSNEGDLVADFFCGSGTTAAVAEKLGRKWICTDLGKFAIHTTRKRLIQVQRELKVAGKPFRAFEVLNLGRYERQVYLGVNFSLDDRGRERLTPSPPSEPYVRFSRIRLSSWWFPHRECFAASHAV
ncbi:MAG: site-specific DNA-methyltransferase, partial [Gammaproteobacteria bacterium]